MDGGGRFVGSVDGIAAACRRARDLLSAAAILSLGAVHHSWRRFSAPPLERQKTGRGIGRLTRTIREGAPKLEALLAAGVIGATGIYGATIGGQWPVLQAGLMQFPDSAARALGFGIRTITIEGQRGLTDAEVLDALRVGDSHSLMFLNVADARQRLVENPLVSDASVRKIYPNRLAVTVAERHAFALWQVGGEVSIISEDGTIIDRLRDRRFADLPLVVGLGASKHARAFEELVERHASVADRLYAGVYVAERRWNLRLRNGVDVLLPETGTDVALKTLVQLIARGDVLDRDITAIDLRIPDQIVVRLSEGAAEQLARDEKPKKKGGTT